MLQAEKRRLELDVLELRDQLEIKASRVSSLQRKVEIRAYIKNVPLNIYLFHLVMKTFKLFKVSRLQKCKSHLIWLNMY